MRPSLRGRAARLAALAALVLVVGCATPPIPSTGRLQHVVLVELRDPSEAGALLAECRARLARIPGVLSLEAGTPVDIGRGTAFQAYHVGLRVEFAGSADYRAYLVHPEHAALVEAWQPRWASLWFCDFQAPAR